MIGDLVSWAVAVVIAGGVLFIPFSVGIHWERGRYEPESCHRKHRDEL